LANAEHAPRPSFRRSLSSTDAFTPNSSRVVKVIFFLPVIFSNSKHGVPLVLTMSLYSQVRTSLFKQSTVVRTLDNSKDFSPEGASPVSQLASSALSSLRLSNNGSFKRPDPPTDRQSPIQVKRRKSLQSIQDNHNTSPQSTLMQYGFQKTATPKFQRCFSETEATIKSALLRASTNPDLIGDFSKPFALPLMEGRHQDLKSISVDTLAALMQGRFKDEIASYTVVDCRYVS
jgi:M-phase inducer phosphatase